MPTLSRTVPLLIPLGSAPAGASPGTASEPQATQRPRAGGQPVLPPESLYLELDVRIAGEPDPRSGYLVSIAEIDRAVRERLDAVVADARPAAHRDAAWPMLLLERLASTLGESIGRPPSSLHLRLTPYHAVSLELRMPPEALITRRFDFCAAHRLHLPDLSDEQNLALFGKCSHPSGHGHNYRLEVTVAAAEPRIAAGIEQWSEIVRRDVVERYDHRNLNLDCPEFRSLNPSVENIARVCHERLERSLGEAGVALRRIRVWESEKTWCEVP